jgi:hypothetical protein
MNSKKKSPSMLSIPTLIKTIQLYQCENQSPPLWMLSSTVILDMYYYHSGPLQGYICAQKPLQQRASAGVGLCRNAACRCRV